MNEIIKIVLFIVGGLLGGGLLKILFDQGLMKKKFIPPEKPKKTAQDILDEIKAREAQKLKEAKDRREDKSLQEKVNEMNKRLKEHKNEEDTKSNNNG